MTTAILNPASFAPFTSNEVDTVFELKTANTINSKIKSEKPFPTEIKDPDASALKRRESLQELPMLKVPEEYAPEVNRVVSQILEISTRKPVSERLLEISQIVSAAVEEHLLRKHEDLWEKKQTVKENVSNQKSTKNWQAVSKLGGGFGSILLAGLGFLPKFGPICTTISKMTPAAGETAERILDGCITELSHEQQLYFNEVQSEKQAKQGLVQMLQQYRGLILELVRLELQASREINQR